MKVTMGCYIMKQRFLVRYVLMGLITLVMQQVNARTNGMLIFLDDQERDMNGVITGDLATALVQKAGPIVTTTSLLANLYDQTPVDETNPTKLFERLEQLKALPPDQQTEEVKNKINSIRTTSAVGVSHELFEGWVLKKVNAQICLLIPEPYLIAQESSVSEIDTIAKGPDSTALELRLGLKVNHMKTLLLSQIARPSLPRTGHYFMKALWDKETAKSPLFVTNSDYATVSYGEIPEWVIYLGGHGLIQQSVAYLSIEEFKEFLQFLETNLRTKLLYYSTCYGAGLNSELLYKNAREGVEKTYPFAIVTVALSDAPTVGKLPETYVENEKIRLKTKKDFGLFLSEATENGIINYRKISNDLENRSSYCYGHFNTIAQIKFPGLPWFSVLDQDKVVSIGHTLAKTRKKPLDIQTFFARGGKQAAPLAVLLYGRTIPFELVLNMKQDYSYPFAMISMIPGPAIHHLQKISSTTSGIDSLLDTFFELEYGVQKVFMIDEIESNRIDYSFFRKILLADLFEYLPSHYTISSVFIMCKGKEKIAYFSYQGKAYVATSKFEIHAATPEEKRTYDGLMHYYGKQTTSETDVASLAYIQAQADEVFSKKRSADEVLGLLKSYLVAMPSDSVLLIPKIRLLACPLQNPDCDETLITALSNLYIGEGRKIIRIKRIIGGCTYLGFIPTWWNNIVIDSDDKGVKVFCSGTEDLGIFQGEWTESKKYFPQYRHLLDRFAATGTLQEQGEASLDTRSVSTLLQEKNVADINTAVARKHAYLQAEPEEKQGEEAFLFDFITSEELEELIHEEALRLFLVASRLKKEAQKETLEAIAQERAAFNDLIARIHKEVAQRQENKTAGGGWTLDADTLEPLDIMAYDVVNKVEKRIEDKKKQEAFARKIHQEIHTLRNEEA